jgi:hypothetical protein
VLLIVLVLVLGFFEGNWQVPDARLTSFDALSLSRLLASERSGLANEDDHDDENDTAFDAAT